MRPKEENTLTNNNPRNEHIPFSFNGSGGEFFFIWIVNRLLIILTLGIYSAWAKVRTAEYFHQNTVLGDSSFDYHGDPKSILKGYMLIGAVLLVGTIAEKISPALGRTIFFVTTLLYPWFLLKSLQFKLSNTSFRGIDFQFKGKIAGLYAIFLICYLALIITLGIFIVTGKLLLNAVGTENQDLRNIIWICLFLVYVVVAAHVGGFFIQKKKSFIMNGIWFGTAAFQCKATLESFYETLFKTILVLSIVIVLLFAALANNLVSIVTGILDPIKELVNAGSPISVFLIFFCAFAAYAPFLSAYVYVTSKFTNVVWNTTTVKGGHRFTCNIEPTTAIWISLSNLFLIGITLGFFKPFATVRTLQYRLSCMSLIPNGSLDDFMADQENAVGSTGEAAADLMDIDIAF